MFIRIVAALVILNCLAVAYWGVATHSRADARRREILRIGKTWQEMGLLSQAEYVELIHISDDAVGRQISDRDMNWLLDCMDKHANRIVAARVAGILQAVASYSPAQRDRVFARTVHLLKGKTTLERLYGVTLQGSLRDLRAVQHLLPLLDDPDAMVRSATKGVLARAYRLTS